MNRQFIIKTYKQLYRYCRVIDEQPVLKYVMSDILKKTTNVATKSLPNWFSPELSALSPSVLDQYLTYYPSESVASYLHKRFQPTPIPVKEDKFQEMTGKWIAFFNAVIVAAKKDYKLNLIDTRQLVENDSVVYMKDKPIYDQVVPELHRVNDVPDVKEGMLVMNYPTNVISVNPTPTFLYRDEIFLVTNVSELGVKGVIINPKNARTRSQTLQNHSLLTITKRKSEVTDKQFIVEWNKSEPFVSHSFNAFNFGLSNQKYLITSNIQSILGHIDNGSKIVRYDRMINVKYPCR